MRCVIAAVHEQRPRRVLRRRPRPVHGRDVHRAARGLLGRRALDGDLAGAAREGIRRGRGQWVGASERKQKQGK